MEADEQQITEDADEKILEPCVEWLRRATNISEETARRYGIRDWVVEQRLRKWRLAGHVARRHDGRWSAKLLSWTPNIGKRRVGHPCKRWRDELVEFNAEIGWSESWISTAPKQKHVGRTWA